MNTNTYLKLCSDYYDLTRPFAAELELNFYLDYAKKLSGPILEPMCGTGRFLIPMLEYGLAIEGFDSSASMLTILKQKCEHKKLIPAISQITLQEFYSHKKYNFIFIPSGSFGLITDLQQAHSCLQKLYDLLALCGKFVFEVDTPESLRNYPLGSWHRSVRQKNDGSSLVFNQLPFFNEESRIFEVLCRYEHVKNGTICATEIENFRVKLYGHNELDSLLRQIGFSFITYKNYLKDPIPKVSPYCTPP
jgi:SAM-dependent methyltransferase